MARCPRCHTEWPASARFCAHDGADLEAAARGPEASPRTCPTCGAEVSAQARFCPRDGTDVVAARDATRQMACPRCGRTYSGGRFCNVDGAALVLPGPAAETGR